MSDSEASDAEDMTRKSVKRSYSRRTDEERIADLQAEIAKQKNRIEKRERMEREKREVLPSIKAIPKVTKQLHKLAEQAREDDRHDVANSVHLFLVGLQRIYDEELASKRPDEVEFEEVRGELPNEEEDDF